MPDGPATHHEDPELTVTGAATTQRTFPTDGSGPPSTSFEPAHVGIAGEHLPIGHAGMNVEAQGGVNLGGAFHFQLEVSLENLILHDLPERLPNISILDPSISVEVQGATPAQASLGLTVLHWQWEYLSRVTAEVALSAAVNYLSDHTWEFHAEAQGQAEAVLFRGVKLFMTLGFEVNQGLSPGGTTDVGITGMFGTRLVLDPQPGQVQRRH
jgi:hypothetical protein